MVAVLCLASRCHGGFDRRRRRRRRTPHTFGVCECFTTYFARDNGIGYRRDGVGDSDAGALNVAGVGAGVTVRFGFRRRAAASAPSSSPSSRVASWFESDARMWSVYLGCFDLGHLRLDGEGWGAPYSDDQPIHFRPIESLNRSTNVSKMY